MFSRPRSRVACGPCLILFLAVALQLGNAHKADMRQLHSLVARLLQQTRHRGPVSFHPCAPLCRVHAATAVGVHIAMPFSPLTVRTNVASAFQSAWIEQVSAQAVRLAGD